MAFERVFKYTGEFGPYQKRILHLVCLVAIPTAIHTMLPMFINADTDHHCRMKSLEGVNCSEWDMTARECEDLKLDMSVPDDDKSTLLVDERKCKIRNITAAEFSPYLNETDIERFDVVDCYAGWIYDKSQYKSTIVQEFDIVCGQSHRVAMSWTIYFVGVLLGSFTFGNIADLLGRKPAFLMALGLQAAGEMAVAFVPAFWLYSFFRFVVGLADMGVYLIGFVLVTEYVGPTKRTMAGSLFAIYWSFGYMCIAGLAFFVREWRKFVIVSTCVCLPIFFIFPFVPESVQWLNSKGKNEKAKEALRKLAASNKTEIPEHAMDEILSEKETEAKQSTVIDLFRHPNLRKKTIILMYIWSVNSCVYYGLSFGSSDLGVNDYLAAAMFGFIELPAYLLSWLALRYIGRRLLMCCVMVTGGCFCFINIWIPTDYIHLRTVIAMIGKFAITASFSIVYIFSAEIFPTVVRSAGMGVCSMCARIGGMLAPQIIFFKRMWDPLPLMVFSVMSIAAGLLTLILPETNNTALPQTIQDGEHFGKKNTKSVDADVYHGLPAAETKA